jgi:hypothetical protein
MNMAFHSAAVKHVETVKILLPNLTQPHPYQRPFSRNFFCSPLGTGGIS